MAVAVTTAAVVATSFAAATTAGAAPASKKPSPGIATPSHSLHGKTAGKSLGSLPAGVPKKGSYGFLLTLDAKSTVAAAKAARAQGKAAARSAAKTQSAKIATVQRSVTGDLPDGSKVIYRTRSVVAGVAVRTDVKNYGALRGIDGVTGVYPITPKKPTNSYAVPHQNAPQAWQTYGDRGQNATIAIIDTGIDYTHTDFGGPGTQAAYAQAGSSAQQANPTVLPTDKVIGGYDFAGDDYNADPTADPDGSFPYQPIPRPDNNPLDCNGHGSHVAGTAAGQGVNADGSTYTGTYGTGTSFDNFKIGPGMAPEAKLYAFRVFGCEGSTDLTGAAIEAAIDPNGDGDPADHVDVANLSLGSDFAPPGDADTVLVQKATDAGVTMAIASGNNGDLYDTGGSPGNAPSALTVAASQDASAVVDSLNVTAPAPAKYPAERSIAYDWANDPDLAGDVARLTDPTNLTGCKALNAADAAAVNGKIAFVNWHDAAPECGSVARSGNLAAAGATGFIFGSDAESFSAGITGSAKIPGVLVAQSGATAIRNQLAAGTTVTIGSTTANGTKQEDESLNETLADFSSRGVRGKDGVKPDVTAVGSTVFSAADGTGTEGVNESGTSMATPMTAGLAGLVTSQHPEWSAEQVKADIMNTAGQDLYTGTNHTGDTYAPNRVGAGRIDAKAALDNTVLAYTTGTGVPTGTVSASFGPLEVTKDTQLQKTITVQNTGAAAATYDVDFDDRTIIPGAEYSVSPATVTVAAGETSTVTVTLTLTRNQLTKTIDPTVSREQAGVPREYVADASGLVTLTPTSGNVPGLRVPVYAAPRPTSTMTQAKSVTLPSGQVATAELPFTGDRVNQGSGATKVQSLVAGFELQATSGKAPTCSATVTTGCVHSAEELGADLKYVGTTSNAPQLIANDEDPLASEGNGLAYFAVSMQGPWRTPAGYQDAEVYIDSTGDGKADVVTYSTRLPSGADQTDVLVAQTVDLNTGKTLDVEGLDARLGDTDAALFDSDTLVLPVGLQYLPGLSSTKSRISYSVLTFTGSSSGPVDQVGDVGSDNTLVGAKTMDVLNPGVAVYGSYNGDTDPLLYVDSPNTFVKIRRDAKAYAADGAQGALLVHFHNAVGNKAQLVSFAKTKSTVGLTMTPNPATHGKKLSGVVTVTASNGVAPTGTVTLKRVTGGGAPATVATGKLVNGKVTLGYTPKNAGTYKYQASYSGDSLYAAGNSAAVSVKIK